VAALALARQQGSDLAEFLRRTAAGRALENIGRGEDVEFCSRRDSVPELPVLRNRQITRAATGALEDPAPRGGAR
jgi:phosphosulfolactate phosphohydrolase-like enzyme